MQIIKYETEEEAQIIIAGKIAQGLLLIEVSNITEGNFLGFSENPIQSKPTTQELLDNQMTLMSGMVDIYMSQLGL